MEKLLGAAVENLEHPDAVQPPNVAMRELAWLPTRCQRVLYRRGITTNAALFALSESQLRAIRPHRPPLLRILELPRDQLQQPPRAGAVNRSSAVSTGSMSAMSAAESVSCSTIAPSSSSSVR
ncbi:hypothetical protein, partial [Nocardia sp. CC201C]|uniref:hypothetical protein n=1 Tax=Nocardia sp. CC201C TaxID=3044575 RepID=UPI0024A7F0F5